MSFWTRTREVGSDWSFDGTTLGRGFRQAWEGLKTAGFEQGLAARRLREEEGIEDPTFWQRTKREATGLAEALGGTFEGLSGIPGLRQTLAVLEDVYDGAIRRPIATYGLMTGDAVNRRDLGHMGDWEAWKAAYNTTTYVTPGQALTYSWLANQHLQIETLLGPDNPLVTLDDLSELERAQFFEDFPTLGIALQDDAARFDPRDRDGARRVYYENTFMKGMSGTLDVATLLVADPFVFGAPVARGVYISRVKRPLDAAALQSGRLEGHVSSRQYRKLKEFVQAEAARPGGTSETVAQRAFANHYQGDQAANMLFDAAKFQRAHSELGGTVDLYDTVFRALYGDLGAWRTLTREAADFADAIGRAQAGTRNTTLAKAQDIGDPAVDRVIEASLNSQERGFITNLAHRNGKWGNLDAGEISLIDVGRRPTGAPRLTWTSAWRTGVHNWIKHQPRAIMGHWARRSAMLLPSQRRGRMLDMHDPNSVNIFRSTFAMSRLNRQDLDEAVSNYAAASNANERFLAYTKAEDLAVLRHAEAYGLRPDQLEDLYPILNKFRMRTRESLARNRMFASSSVRQRAEEAYRDGRPAMGDRLREIADDVDSAVQRGEMPGAHYRMIDPESGVLTYIPEDTALGGHRPLLRTQHADNVPVIDFNVLDNALWWHLGRGGEGSLMRRNIGRTAHSAVDATRAMMDVANTVWKAAAILRPGYIWRTLSDEILRQYAVLGAQRLFASVGPGAKNMAHNMRARGRLLGEVIDQHRTRRLATGATTIRAQAEVRATGKSLETPASRAERQRPFEADDLVGRTYDDLFADGTITLDDFIGRINSHGSAGTLPAQLKKLYLDRREGTITDTEFRKMVTNFVLRNEGRGAFVSPTWQSYWIQHVSDKGRPSKAGERPQLIDPFTGETVAGLTPAKVRKDFTRGEERVLDARAAEGRFHINDVYDYIFDNIDLLHEPNVLLGSYIRDDGRMVMAAFRSKDPDAVGPLKATSGQQIKLPFDRKGELYRDSGMADVHLDTPVGPVTFRAGFKDDAGDRFRKQTRSRGPRDSVIDNLTDIEYSRLKIHSEMWRDISPSHRQDYKQAWERAVNVQLRGDPVAHKFMEGETYQQVVHWLFNTPAGKAYQREMGDLWRARYSENVAAIQTMVDTYLPVREGAGHQSRLLRGQAARGKAQVEDMRAYVPESELPMVHGASIEGGLSKGPIQDIFKSSMDKIWHWMSSMPHDKLVRHPFAADRYRVHVDELAQARGHFAAREGRSFTDREVRAIESEARTRALRDSHTYMFFNNAHLDLAKSARFVSPFASALTDSLLKHGVALRHNPERYWQINKVWNAPERNGLITDADGAQLRIENGIEQWYTFNPVTQEYELAEGYEPRGRYITYRMPSWMAPKSFGEDTLPVARMNKQIFRTALSLPTFGPMVAVPANEFALNNPEFSENEFFRRYVLPFGTSDDPMDHVVPANIRNHWRRWVRDDETFAQGQVTQIFAADMTDYSLGIRETPPTFEEARQKAADMRALRYWFALGGFSTQFQSPYQPFVDYYRQLRLQEIELRQQAQAEGRDLGEIESADDRFLREVGDEYFQLTARVTRNAMGIPATIEGDRAFRKYQDMIERHSELAGLILGAEGAGEFNHAVYQNQKRMLSRPGSGELMRTIQSPEDSWRDTQTRQGWIEYGKLHDLLHVYMNRMGITSLNDARAEPLRRVRDAWLRSRMFTASPWGEQVMNPWFEDFRTVDTSRLSRRLHGMRDIVQDRRLQGRDDIRGLAEYLRFRDMMRLRMAQRGVSSLANQDAEDLRREWERMVFIMKDRNLAFASLYDRWLSADETLEAS